MYPFTSWYSPPARVKTVKTEKRKKKREKNVKKKERKKERKNERWSVTNVSIGILVLIFFLGKGKPSRIGKTKTKK